MTLSCGAARLLVSDYIDGELDPDVARLLEGHLRTCRNCPPLYTALLAVLNRLTGQHAPMPPPARERALRRLQNLEPKVRPVEGEGGVD